MPWHSTSPDGTISVKENRTSNMQDNTTYIETTMGDSVVGTNKTTTRDHFWNVGPDEDGRHRFMQSPGFTVGGSPADPVLGTNMNGVIYIKEDETTDSRFQGFYRNTNGIYQFIPAFLEGTHIVTSSFTDIPVDIPQNVYGEIKMFRTDANGAGTIQDGFFKSTTTALGVAAYRYVDTSGSSFSSLRFGFTNLRIAVRTDSASSGNSWNYRITYRAI